MYKSRVATPHMLRYVDYFFLEYNIININVIIKYNNLIIFKLYYQLRKLIFSYNLNNYINFNGRFSLDLPLSDKSNSGLERTADISEDLESIFTQEEISEINSWKSGVIPPSLALKLKKLNN